MEVDPRIWRPRLDKKKYKQVILFLLNSGANNVHLGKVKLFKLLYYIDFDHFEFFKASVTGDSYRKLDYGPVPMHADVVLSEMAHEGLIAIDKVSTGDYTQYRFRPLATPNSGMFSGSEMQALDQVVLKWANHTRADIVAATHGEAPWRAVQMGDEIPYTLAFYRHEVGDAEEKSDEEPQELVLAR